MLKMSVRTSASSPAQVLSTRPGMLSGPPAFRGLTLVKVLRVSAASMVRAIPIEGGEGQSFPLVVRFGAAKHVKKLLSLSGQVICQSLDSLPYLSGVSCVTEWSLGFLGIGAFRNLDSL